jgi:hypothetical protein
MAQTIQPNIGDIILDKKGNYYRVVMYCRHTERPETLIIFESLVAKKTHAIPNTSLTTDKFMVAIRAEDLES